MKIPAWLRHGTVLAFFYWLSSTTLIFLGVVLFHGQIRMLASNTAVEMSMWLRGQPDEVIQAKFEQLKQMRDNGPTLTGNIWLLDESGNVLASSTRASLPPYWKEHPLPKTFDEVTISDLEAADPYSIALLHTDPKRYLLWADLKFLPKEQNPPTVFQKVLRGGGYFMLGFILFAAFLSTITVLYVLRNKARQAKVVMDAIERGNLKERFTVSRIDEIGGLMVKFNAMADTIESLVNRLKRADQSRKSLLQELNHDLRTPLTSLHLMVETLTEHHAKFSAKKRAGVLKDLHKELDYLTRLVQFLFSLPDMEEASYRVDFKREDLLTLVKDEMERRGTSSVQGRTLKYSFLNQGLPECLVSGDRSLLNRLVRNCLDNAAKFARHRVHAALTETRTHWRLEIFDDGPGPSPEALKTFGARPKNTTGLEVLKPETSVGLGSAIMTAVTELHGGSLTLQSAPKPWGAVVTVLLPKATPSPIKKAA